ncbi:protein of unknown function [Micromonospora haikouensis]|uniref:Permease n=1 Tax=Micromonospora haikouensis TaxID=686309 RepID=A0A1C4XQT1_9ACTN|nr:protein of unknown function [Micromonospora haikouensis]
MAVNQLTAVAADLVAISVLVFGVYFPRHHRRDLVTAFLGVNIGVVAVSIVLGNSGVGVGLGLGLFGVLSIIRLRSDEIAQHEIAYYFAALALGLVSGLSGPPGVLPGALMTLIVAGLFLGDHPRLYGRHRSQNLRLDVAHTDENALRGHLEMLLDARVVGVVVRSVDLVNETTLVDVRYVVRPRSGERDRQRTRGPAVERMASVG